MDRRRLIRILFTVLPVLALLALLLAALLLAGDAETDTGRLARWSPWLFGGALAAVLVLLATIARELLVLRAQLARRAPGARLSARLTLALVLLAVPPVLLVYGFALKFLGASIDSWFNVRIEQALDDALALGRLYVDDQLDDARRRTRTLADALAALPPGERAGALDAGIDALDALQLALFGADGTTRGLAAADPRFLLPSAPESSTLLRVLGGGSLAQSEPSGDDLVLHVLLPVDRDTVLQAYLPLARASQPLARRLESSFHDYQRLAFLRDSLKFTFVLILTAVLLLSLLLAVLAALALARRQVQPIARLAEATGEVAAGRFGRELPPAGEDELGFLTASFNRMTRELAGKSAEAEAGRAEIERQRAWLGTVLGRLSSGVLGFDRDGVLRTANEAGAAILGVAEAALAGHALEEFAALAPRLAPLATLLHQRLGSGVREWREELRLPGAPGAAPQVLMLRGAALPDEAGHVVVFDDLTVLAQAQRDAAWAEVARRLAHEVRNPLTPIQLAAERLRLRVLGKLAPEEAQVLDKATQTIVAQVEALKAMVIAFGEYARPPQLALAPLDLNALIGEVLELYAQAGQVRATRRLDPALPRIAADAGRIRQLLHNLIKNAIEARGESAAVALAVSTARDGDVVELAIADDGPGLPPDFDARWFEPYTTTKARGTGLGLAIVKKIAEEHGGTVGAANAPGGGARFTVRLPLA